VGHICAAIQQLFTKDYSLFKVPSENVPRQTYKFLHFKKMRNEEESNKEQRAIIPDKYFCIGEVSKITYLPPYILRFWETQFKELHPQKSRGGHRRYQKKDVELVLWIKNLLYEKKFTINGARKELRNRQRKDWLDPLIIKKELQETLQILE